MCEGLDGTDGSETGRPFLGNVEMPLVFPNPWASLARPHQRAELMDNLDELSRPDRASLWLSPDKDTPAGGIEDSFHFFFDDTTFDWSAIGASLFDKDELAAVTLVMNALDVIHRCNPNGDDRYFLEHPRWSSVASSAAIAYTKLAVHGLAEWHDGAKVDT